MELREIYKDSELNESLDNGSLVESINEDSIKYPPKLLVNNPSINQNILTPLLEELEQCKSFMFIVAFVTESGLATLKSHFLDLKRKGIRGRLLTSTYLHFNHPKVFYELLKIDNMEVRLSDLKGFHSKGYIFINEEHHSLIIGSANLTAQALKVNYEWSVKLTLNSHADSVKEIISQYEEVWNKSYVLTEAWIKDYEKTYVRHSAEEIMVEWLSAAATQESPQKVTSTIEPNKMQKIALQKIEQVRLANKQKALIVSATGTGKTYLSAFDVKSFNPSRMLFIAHREQILQQARADFTRIIGGNEQNYGILSSNSKSTQAKYLFATIQSISKTEVLNNFSSEEFDYILIDEVHKAGASSYQKVIDHFCPQFLMGMTATPERTDEFNIYQLFDYNVAYEIRLQEALEEDMLCSFHYFGVTDFEYDGRLIDDTAMLTKLATEERVDHIISKIEYYGFSGENVKGLIFCSRKEEAIKLSQMMNDKGYRTIALTGEDSIQFREQQIEALESGKIDYILTVDIFNEGIDIPCINQVILLRQTQSSIVFVQQLGRGLRKHNDKEFVTIIDFIGNYKNNYLIPIALSDDRSMNKDNIRRSLNDTSYIKGVSTINFEEVAKAQIFKSINKSNLTELKKLREAFLELQYRIGRVPMLFDFIIQRSIDPIIIVKTFESYYKFLKKIKIEVNELTLYEEKILYALSAEILPGKRKHEVILLDLLIGENRVSYDQYIEVLQQTGCKIDKATIASVLRVYDLTFFITSQRIKYGEEPICILENGYFKLNEKFRNALNTNIYFREMVIDILNCAKEKVNIYSGNSSLTLYQKYSRKDVCKLLNWESDETSTVYGYKIKNNTCPIFVTYHKQEEIDSGIKYEDEFLSPKILRWFTRRNRTLESEEVKKIVNAEKSGIEIHIFVKKDDDEGSEFYYLGRANPNIATVEETVMEGKAVINMQLELENNVESSLYTYIRNGYIN
ncbi:DUF3427 domain-containing protein [Paenibacillus oralis]|uniref:DUF3427 domain-containing protein n=1 Tax=Paenibacillus oralis TaxID=2490856 RepID=A0A3P3U431_9BACL|nr:DEAD/DEAH box helicase [Paenibacillus oralis]RRJ63333.1 DUF3427 domain-containing protein [Paenibacillus oralis]